jgi:hypothetical protein
VYLLAREYVRQVAIANGHDVTDLPPADDPVYPRRNVTALDVYTRPAEQFRYARSTGEPDEAALDAALARIEDVVDLDLAATRRQGFADAFEALGVKHYRRVIHPELSKGGTCGLCVAASTQVYRADDLLPIHAECKCDVAEVAPGSDAADLLNGIDLSKLYGDAGGNAAEDLKRTRYRIDDHGELGPVLVPERQTESKAHRSARTAKVVRPLKPGADQWRAELQTLTGTERSLTARLAAGEDVSTPLQWQRDRIASLRDRLGRAA